MTNPRSTLIEIVKLYNSISTHEGLADELSSLDKELQDIEHFIEFSPNKNMYLNHLVTCELREVRRRRREVKNQIELLTPIVDFCKSNGDLKGKINKVVETLGKIEQSQNAKVYTPRVRHDLFESEYNIKVESKPQQKSLDKMLKDFRKQSNERRK